MSDYDTVLVETAAGVLTITLNRPERLNAITDRMTTELQQVLEMAERDRTVRCIVLTGAGRGFCAGQDLGEIGHGDGPADLGADLRRRYNPIVRRLRTIEKPVAASINGVAAGAGLSLALACDLRLAASSASFTLAFVKVGLVPDSGATFLLPLIAGMGRATELAFTGDRIGADEALRINLVNRVVPDAQLADATRELAERLAALPTRAIGLTKQAFNRALLPRLDALLDEEAELQAIAGRTADHAEGVAAFRAKRVPRFTGE